MPVRFLGKKSFGGLLVSFFVHIWFKCGMTFIVNKNKQRLYIYFFQAFNNMYFVIVCARMIRIVFLSGASNTLDKIPFETKYIKEKKTQCRNCATRADNS